MQEIKKTCLFDEHVKLNARMEEFAGFDMPIVYSSIKAEHNAVRNDVGMFDVGHMGEFIVKGAEATEFVEKVFTNTITNKEDGSVTYGMMCYENGTIVDDLLVYKFNEFEFIFVVNASNVAKDYAWVVEQTDNFDVTVKNVSDDYQEIAVQGPNAEAKMLEALKLDLSGLGFFNFGNFEFQNNTMIISRTGYTGEDGFEIYADEATILKLWQILIQYNVTPCGLGSRDTLRFEAALPLYGHEISDEINPLEAGLKIFTKVDSDIDFIGKKAMMEKPLTRRVVGIELTQKSIPRQGYPVCIGEEEIGYITTGYLSISLDKPIAMAMINRPYTKADTNIEVKIRNKKFAGFVRDKKFLKKNYKTKGA